jgi:hypothetical protein
VSTAPAPPVAPYAPDVSELTRTLAARGRALESMQTGAVMEYVSGDRRVKAKEEITVRRPDYLRVDAHAPFGVGLIVAARGGELSIFDPAENRLMRGSATADALDRFARIPMAPREAVSLLMGVLPDASRVAAAADSVGREGAMTRAVYHGDASTLELGFVGGELAMVREVALEGRVLYEVRYRDYRDIGGIMLAYEVDARFPPSETSVKFRFERPIINGEVPLSLFELKPGPGATLVNLDHAAAAGGRFDG